MRASLSDNAPAFLLVLASAILAVAFSLPIGAERLARTQYQRLEGFVGSFESPKAPGADAKGALTTGTETWGLVAQAVRQRYTPIEANALLSYMKDENLQGNLADFFEGKLKENVIFALKSLSYGNIYKFGCRLVIELGEEEDFNEFQERLKKVCGIAFFALAQKLPMVDLSSKEVIKQLRDLTLDLAKKRKFKSFAVFTRRNQVA